MGSRQRVAIALSVTKKFCDDPLKNITKSFLEEFSESLDSACGIGPRVSEADVGTLGFQGLRAKSFVVSACAEQRGFSVKDLKKVLGVYLLAKVEQKYETATKENIIKYILSKVKKSK